MKYIFIFIIFVSSSFSAYLYVNKNKCVDSYYYKNSILYYVDSDSNDTLRSTYQTNQNFLSGYIYDYDSNICHLKSILQDLQLSNSDYNFLMALSGLLIGFSFLLSILYVFKRK